jgi:phosphoglycerate dehydrogenase-like enzyme
VVTSLRIAVLDDYTGSAEKNADWARLARARIRFYRDHVTDQDALARRLRDADVVVIERERTPIRRQLIESLPNLKLIVATGPVNWSIDYAAAAERKIPVCGTEARQDLAPELAIALILASARRIVAEDRSIRSGGWISGEGTSLKGKILGLVGLGQTGRMVAALARPFGMIVQAWSQNLTAGRAAEADVIAVSREVLFRTSDFISLHVVLGERTRGMVDAATLAMMKPTAHLINTSRGALVDETALVAALVEQRIAGAALDVFATEPLPPDSPLRSLENAILTPHIGYTSDDQSRRFYTQVVENIEAFQSGAPIRLLGP